MYDYTISYKPGDKHANADSLSQLPLLESPLEVPPPPELILMLETLQASPVHAKQIWQWTDRDPTLTQVRNLILQGWRITEDGGDVSIHQKKGGTLQSRMGAYYGAIEW